MIGLSHGGGDGPKHIVKQGLTNIKNWMVLGGRTDTGIPLDVQVGFR